MSSDPSERARAERETARTLLYTMAAYTPAFTASGLPQGRGNAASGCGPRTASAPGATTHAGAGQQKHSTLYSSAVLRVAHNPLRS